MKTNNSIIKSIARLVSVVLLMAVGVGQMWGAAVASLTPTDGKYYIIALYHDSKYYALPHIGSTGNLYCGEECTLNGSNQVTAIAGETSPYDCLWLLTSAGSAGQFYISYDNNGTRMYLYKNGTTGDSNYKISATSPVSSTNHKWEFTSGTANSVTAYSVKSLKSGASANTVLRGDDITLQNDETCYGFNVDGTSNSYEITLLPVQPLTVTFDAEGGSCATSSLPEASSNAGVTLPEASPSDACESDGWEFAGWATSAVTEQNTSPRLFSAGDTYYPLDYGTSLHAVYRKLTSGTSTATFDASDRSDLTQVSMKVYNPGWYIHTATNMDLYIKGYGYYSNTWDLDNTWGAGGLGEAYIDAHTKIASIAVTLKSGTVLLGSVSTNNGSAELSGSGTSQSITCSGNVTRVTMYAPDSKETQITSLEVTYYNAKFNSNPSCCAYEVSYSESGSSHISSMTFSESSVPTCGDAASRTITITVTPASGYTLFGDTKPVFTKTSGTVADPTITGPTDNGDGTYSYECTFASNANGAGTFAISPGQFTNYRTACSTTYDITLDKNGGDANGSAKVADNGTTLTSILAPTKNGYDIEGYYTTSGLTTKIATDAGALSASVTVSSDDWTDENSKWILGDGATFYTKWTAHEYTITYEGLEGASNTNPTSYTVVTPTITLVNPGSRTGYTFSGWTLGGSPITQIVLGSTGDKTITATWSINTPNLAVSAADHVVITATPASESAIAEGANRNVNYNKTVTLNCTPDEHWNLVWDVYKTGESSTKVALSGSGDGATFTMPDYGVTVSAVMTEAAYKTVCFKNNGEDIDGYASVKVYVGESPVAPTLTDGTSGDACDATSDTHYGWTQTTMPDVVPSKATIDAYTGAQTVYAKAATLPAITAGVDGTTITYHAVWAESVGVPSNEWQLVTSTSNLSAGDKIVFANAYSGSVYVMGKDTTTEAGFQFRKPAQSGTFSVSSSKITITTIASSSTDRNNPHAMTVGKSGDYWTFYDPILSAYLTCVSTSDKNKLGYNASLTDAGKWSLSITSSVATIVSQISEITRNQLQANGNPFGLNSNFTCTANTQTNPAIFKNLSTTGYQNFLTTCCTQYEISGASTSGTAVTGGTLTSTDNSACEDREVKITANVSDGYRFDSWTITVGGSPVARKDGSAEIEDGKPIYVFDMPAADVTVSAAFTRVYTVTYDANGGTGEMIDVNSPYAAGDKVTVLANTFTKAGYNFDSWSYSPAVSVTDGKFDMPSSDVTITAQWTAKPLNNIILAQTEAVIYDKQYVQIEVSYDPADIVTKGYTLTGPALTKVVTTGSTQTQLKISATKAGVIIGEVVSESVSIKANADETKTASVTVTIKPLPLVHFVDIIHSIEFGDVVEEIVDNALSGTKTTPTHSDVSDPGVNYNSCERGHLHLLGWIESTWADAHPGATSGEITGAGSGIYYEAGASINVEVQNGKTFYAVWCIVE